MPAKTKKIDKDFVLSDSSVNVYNYRMLTAGYVMEEYTKNPIGYYNHIQEGGVLVRWEDIRIEGDKILGKPVINLSHPRGQQTVDEIENGFLNGASMGDTVVLDYTYEHNPANPDEPILVITRWYNKECSVVDKPGNRNSFVQSLFDADNQPVKLQDLSDRHFKNSDIAMEEVKLAITPDLVRVLNLSDKPNATAITQGIKNLADKVDALEKEKTTLATDKQTAEKALKDLQDSTVKTQVKTLLADAMKGEKPQISKDLADKLEAKFEMDPVGLKGVLDAIPGYNSIVENLNDKSKQDEFTGKTWAELHQSGKLPALKDKNLPLFKQLYQAEYGKEYKENA